MMVFRQSVLDELYRCYSESGAASGGAVNERFELLEETVTQLPKEAADRVMEIVCGLCQEHERQAFIAGVRTGVRLNSELNGV